MADYKFAGTVTSKLNEVVTITVTKPDGTKDVFDALTLADGSYSVIKAYSVAGNYTAQAHMDASAEFQAWDSAIATFTVNLTPRTGTLTVTLV